MFSEPDVFVLAHTASGHWWVCLRLLLCQIQQPQCGCFLPDGVTLLGDDSGLERSLVKVPFLISQLTTDMLRRGHSTNGCAVFSPA